jgi:hypothetical protein
MRVGGVAVTVTALAAVGALITTLPWRSDVVIVAVKQKLLPAAHVDVPFQAGVKGSMVDAQFHVSRADGYTLYLNLDFKEGDADDRDRVRKLVGSSGYDGTGPGARQIDPGLSIPVRLSVGRVDAGKTWSVLDDVFTDHRLEGYSATDYSKIITEVRLERGDYRVRIEALADIPELSGRPVHFDIHVRPQ